MLRQTAAIQQPGKRVSGLDLLVILPKVTKQIKAPGENPSPSPGAIFLHNFCPRIRKNALIIMQMIITCIYKRLTLYLDCALRGLEIDLLFK